MSTQFEFHLKGASAPAGELEADHLLAIVQSLKEVATTIGRAETDAQPLGRAPRRVRRVAGLTIGLLPGSTTVLARRAGPGPDALDFDLADEEAFDRTFTSLVESIADDSRPDWVDDSLSRAASGLAVALQHAAPEVEFWVDGETRRAFKTAEVHRQTWQVEAAASWREVTFVGRLYAVNLNTHRLQVQDDVGHQVALPDVSDDAGAAKLLGSYVTVTGAAERDARGQLTRIREARLEPAPDPLSGRAVPDRVSVEDVLASAPGVEPGGVIDLTDEEADAFFEAMGL